MTNCPPRLRGDLSKWLCEINTGVYVGNVSSRVRDAVWDRVCQNLKNGGRGLFPAYAGVIPGWTRRIPIWTAFPRTRGGDPNDHLVVFKLTDFSPHTRG